MKNNIFIMGDSYSTYKGYNPEGYHVYYSDERTAAPVVSGAEKTWWKIFEKENNLNIVLNDSFSGSTICNTVREALTVESSFVSRIDRYISESFFTENEINTMQELTFRFKGVYFVSNEISGCAIMAIKKPMIKGISQLMAYLKNNNTNTATTVINAVFIKKAFLFSNFSSAMAKILSFSD